MVQGGWVGEPLPVFLFVPLFSILLFIPYERISFPGWGRRFLSLSLAPRIGSPNDPCGS